MSEGETTSRVMHGIARRRLQVIRVVDITPRMRRVTFAGPQLQGFVSLAADDHIKLLFARNAEEQQRLDDFLAGREGDKPVVRDYTPRCYDPQANELDIDFVLHGDGPASTWAAQAAPGQHLHIAGPRSSLVVADTFAAYLLIGDETALPAIGRWLEELPAGRQVTALVEIETQAERQPLPSAADVSLQWLLRSTGHSLEQAVAQLQLPTTDIYAWVACEAGQARRIRRLLIDQHGLAEEQVRAAGYWRQRDPAGEDLAG